MADRILEALRLTNDNPVKAFELFILEYHEGEPFCTNIPQLYAEIERAGLLKSKLVDFYLNWLETFTVDSNFSGVKRLSLYKNFIDEDTGEQFDIIKTEIVSVDDAIKDCLITASKLGNSSAMNFLCIIDRENRRLWLESASINIDAAKVELAIGHIRGDWPEADASLALSLLEQTANSNKPSIKFNSLIYLGVVYALGLGVNIDYKRAWKLYREALSINGTDFIEDWAKAYAYIGMMYEHGLGVAKNQTKALECYLISDIDERGQAGVTSLIEQPLFYNRKKATFTAESTMLKSYRNEANRGNVIAMFRLGNYYLKKNSIRAARKWQRKAFEAGCVETMFVCYFQHLLFEDGNPWFSPEEGQCGESLQLDACNVFRQRAEKGDYLAMRAYVHMQNQEMFIPFHREGLTMSPRDLLYAFTAYDKGMWDMKRYLNNFGTHYYLGKLYEEGQYVLQNYIKAINCYKKEIALHPDGEPQKIALARLYLYYYGKGMVRFYDKAEEIYRSAGYKGLSELAYRFFVGEGVMQDCEKALELCEEMVLLSSKSINDKINKDIIAQLFRLADAFLGDNINAQTLNCAAKVLVMAKSLGSESDRLLTLANRCFHGINCVTNIDIAEQLFMEAGESGLKDLAYRYLWGIGVPRDKDKALILYKRAGCNVEEINNYYKSNGLNKGQIKTSSCREMVLFKPSSSEDVQALRNFYRVEKSMNDEEILEFFKSSVNKESIWRNTFARIGMMHELGRGTLRDYEKAAEYYCLSDVYRSWQKSNETEEFPINIDLMHSDFSNLQGLYSDWNEALKHYETRAWEGNPAAMFRMAAYYSFNRLKGRKYLFDAANLRLPIAWSQIGRNFDSACNGMWTTEGVDPQPYYDKAIELFEPRAAAGDRFAMVELRFLKAHDKASIFVRGIEDGYFGWLNDLNGEF